MRPGDFSPGNFGWPPSRRPGWTWRFNEAGGFLPRKPCGDSLGLRRRCACFNEAGGFLPRKHKVCEPRAVPALRGFNEAGGFLPRKRLLIGTNTLKHAAKLQ